MLIEKGRGRTIGHLSQFLHSRFLKLAIRMNSHFHSESACLKDTADKLNGSGFLISESIFIFFICKNDFILRNLLRKL